MDNEIPIPFPDIICVCEATCTIIDIIIIIIISIGQSSSSVSDQLLSMLFSIICACMWNKVFYVPRGIKRGPPKLPTGHFCINMENMADIEIYIR